MKLFDVLVGALEGAGQDWYAAKTHLESSAMIQSDAWHIIVGVVLQLGFAAILRRPVSSIMPWLTVLGVELLNEWNDLRISVWPSVEDRIGESAKDIVLTMLVPTVLLIVVRKFPRLVRA